MSPTPDFIQTSSSFEFGVSIYHGEIMHRRFGLSAAIGDQNITVTLRPTHHKPFAVCLFPIARVAFAQVVKIGI